MACGGKAPPGARDRIAPNVWGYAFIAAQTLAVAALTLLEHASLRSSPQLAACDAPREPVHRRQARLDGANRRRPAVSQAAICALGVEREISTSSGVMSAGTLANSGVER